MTWTERAACKDVPPDLFFPDPEDRSASVALEFCASCPVQHECLEDALSKPRFEDHGIRGNATTAERNRLRRLRRQPSKPLPLPLGMCLVCDLGMFVESSEVRPDGTWARATLCCSRGHVQHLTMTLEVA